MLTDARRAALLMISLTALFVGCAPRVTFLSASVARQTYQQLNDNFAAIDQSIDFSESLVSFKFRDDDGVTRAFVGYTAGIIFQPPRNLIFDVRQTLGGTVARIGSNDERYWLWVDVPEQTKLWWGSWDAVASAATIVPPNHVMRLLLLQPLPVSESGSLPPLLYETQDRRVLTFVSADAEGGWSRVVREIVLSKSGPPLPREIIDYDPAGRVIMHTRYSRYRRATSLPGQPLTPASYVAEWPQRDAELRLDVGRIRLRAEPPPFEFPSRWRGAQENLDRLPGWSRQTPQTLEPHAF